MQLIIALALLGAAQGQINTLKYTQVGVGACRGNGGPADKAEAMSPSNGHHMMAGLFMPNGVDPMCHGNYVGDATACECEDATKNDDGSDGALATTLGYGAIAAAALLA